MSHYIYAWPQGATLSTIGVHTFPGPHGVIFAQGIGLPALLAPFIAVGNVPLAFVAFFTVNAIGFVYIHQRASPARRVWDATARSSSLWRSPARRCGWRRRRSTPT